MKAFCSSANAEMGWALYLQVVETHKHYMSQLNLFDLFVLSCGGEQKTSLNCPCAL